MSADNFRLDALELDSSSPYRVLGVAPSATAGEIRRAYRRLALRLHPDRAGPDSAEHFGRVAAAYRLLADAAARAQLDAATRAATRDRAAAAAAIKLRVHVIARLAAPLATLIERGVARRRPDGVVELALLAHEARDGGTAALGVSLRVACPTCGGCAEKDRLWCVRCNYDGAIDDVVTVGLAIPAGVADGTTFTVRFDDEDAPPLRLCVRRVAPP